MSDPKQDAASSSLPEMEPNEAPASTPPVRSGSLLWKILGAIAVAALIAYPLTRSSKKASSLPDEPDLQLARSVQFYQEGAYDKAIETARAALKLKPNFAAAYNNLAVSYLQMKKYDEALENAQQALRIAPDFQLAKNNLKWIQDSMTATQKPAAATKPGTAAWYDEQSLASYQAQKYQETIQFANQALQQNPKDIIALNNLGAAYNSMQKWDDAIGALQKAVAISPDFQLAKNNLNWAIAEKSKKNK